MIGDMVGVAKYKPIIATKAIILISAVIVSAVVAFVIVNHFKSKKNDQENNY